jgi:hypothetical protein
MGVKKNNLIQGAVDDELKRQFDEMLKERGFQVGKVIEAETRLWLSLPPDVQAGLYSKTLTGSAFIQLVQEIVDQRIQAGKDSAKALLERHKKRQGQTG